MKKKKINFQYVANLGYFDFYRTKINGVCGFTYVLCNRLTDVQRDEINSYNNTKIGLRTCLQAPEIKHDLLFVGNKCF